MGSGNHSSCGNQALSLVPCGPDPHGQMWRFMDVVAECVGKQAECGLDIITDGELSKPGFFVYVKERSQGVGLTADWQGC